MKPILWADYGGSVGTAALVQVINSGKVLSNIPNLDLWVEAGIVATDVLASDHMGDVGAGLLNGAGIAAVALMTRTVMDRYVLPTPTNTILVPVTTTGSTASTGSSGTSGSTTPTTSNTASSGASSL